MYVECRYRHESLLFDFGDLHRLPPRKLLKVDYIFVSHTHKDHSIGFDHLLRLCLGRDKPASVSGVFLIYLAARQAGALSRQTQIKAWFPCTFRRNTGACRMS